MPISTDRFESLAGLDEDGLPSEAAAILEFLTEQADQAFLPSEIVAAVDVERTDVDAILPELAARGFVRHRDGYWTVGDEHRVVGLAASIHATRSVNDELGFEDPDEWMEHAAGEKE